MEHQDSELRAILVADVEGYARLMSANEEEAHRLTFRCLGVFRSLAQQHNGTLVKTTGDGVVLEFSSATRAVRYGLAVQHRIGEVTADVPEDRRPRFRIGVHLGEIIHQGGDIYGHSVNVAARIESYAEPGGICVTQIVYDLVRQKLPIGFECLGERRLKNVPDPVVIYRVRPTADAAIRAPSVRRYETPLALPDRPSIAVLPFDNRSASPDTGFLSDGITEDIISNLCKFEELFVVARNSSFMFKNEQVSPATVARELGVRYVLEGTVRVAGSRVRIGARLTDAPTAQAIWAQNYDRDFSEIFDIQDDVAKVIVSTISSRVRLAEADRRNWMSSPNLNAYSELLHGRELMLRYTAEDNEQARRHFQAALEYDPTYSPACAAMARSYNYEWQFSWGDEPELAIDRAVEWAEKAVSYDRSSARARSELGFSLLFKKQLKASLSEFRKARELNPNDADIMAEMSDALTYNGEMNEAVALLKQAMRLNPYFPDTYLWYLADAYFALRQYEDTIETLQRMTNPVIGSRLLAASYAYLGQEDAARTHAAIVLKNQPDFSINEWVNKQPEINPAETLHFAEGLRKAGLPD
jgi:adenylate cyclase